MASYLGLSYMHLGEQYCPCLGSRRFDSAIKNDLPQVRQVRSSARRLLPLSMMNCSEFCTARLFFKVLHRWQDGTMLAGSLFRWFPSRCSAISAPRWVCTPTRHSTTSPQWWQGCDPGPMRSKRIKRWRGITPQGGEMGWCLRFTYLYLGFAAMRTMVHDGVLSCRP